VLPRVAQCIIVLLSYIHVEEDNITMPVQHLARDYIRLMNHSVAI